MAFIYFALTLAAVALAWRRGDFSSRLCAALIMGDFIVSYAITYTLGSAIGMRCDVVFNGLVLTPAGVYCWLRTGRVWPLVIMALAMFQVVAALDYSASAPNLAAWTAYNHMMAVAFVAELLILGGGTLAHDIAVRFLRGGVRLSRRARRMPGYVRPVTREKAK